MNCNTCSSLIPPGAQFCPRCGTPSPVYHANAYDPTARASQQLRYQNTDTVYGSDPYAQTVQQDNMHVPPAIAVPPKPKRGGNIALIVLMLLLAAVVVGSGSYLLASHFIKGNSVQGSPSATTTTLTNHATVNATATANPTATVNATATANPDPNPYASKTGALVLNDPLQDNSKGYQWDETTINNGGTVFRCGFANGAYHITADNSGALTCNPEAPALTLSDLAFEAKVTIIKGNEAGVVVRFDQTKGIGYLFSIDINGTYTIYTTNFVTNDVSKRYIMLRHGLSGQIKQGLNQTNLVAIVADKSSISVYINGSFVDTIQNSYLASGQIGIYGSSNHEMDIVASDARVWKL